MQDPKNMNNDEVQEYLNKLQTGKQQLPADASALERTVLENLNEISKRIREQVTMKNDSEKQVLAIQERIRILGSDIDTIQGEATGYARILVSAEDARRAPPTPVAPSVETATAPIAKKPGPKKGVQPAHLKALKGGASGNGMIKAVPEPVKIDVEAPGADEPEGEEESAAD
jgi:hypothetical protein